MAYDTNNPLGSKDPRDLYDNATNFDKYANGAEPFYPNRFGALKLSIDGMNQAFESAQDGRDEMFQAFLDASNYSYLGEYVAGLTFVSRAQYVVRSGVMYIPNNDLGLPYTTTGVWATEQALFKVLDPDNLFSQDLANTTDPLKGAALVGRGFVTFAKIADMLAVTGNVSQTVYLTEYFQGSGIGGGLFKWEPGLAKSAHDGGIVISPTVPWAGTFDTITAFLAGTGETVPAGSGCWVRQINHEIHVEWFGAVIGDTSKNNTPVLAAVKKAMMARIAPSMPIVYLPRGEMTYSASPNWAETHGVRIKGYGSHGTRMRYTGAGAAILFDSSAYGVTFRSCMQAEDFLVDLTSTGMAALRLVNCDRGLFKGVQSINGAQGAAVSFDLQLAVLCRFDSCGMTVNRWPITSWPAEVWRLAASALGQNTTGCTFINCSGEGATLANWRFLNADNNVTMGGTAEAATGTGRGLLFNSPINCKGNVLIQMCMEHNPGGDFLLGGLNNALINGYAINDPVVGFVSNDAVGARVEGLVCNSLTVQVGAKGTILKGIAYNAKGPAIPGTFLDSGTDTQMGGVWNIGTSLYEYPKKSSFGISATVGSFTYVNTTGSTVQVFIAPGAGGTITQILYQRAVGDTATLNPASGSILLSPGDQVTVSSATTAPSMSGRRMSAGVL